MNSTNSSEAKIQQLSKRLQQSIQSRKQLEDQYNNDYNVLAELIIKLTHACTGVDHELENRLVKLRGLLERNSGIAALEDSISEIEAVVQKHSINVQGRLKETTEQANKSLEQLSRWPLAEGHQQQLQKLQQLIESPTVALTHYAPITVGLLQLYADAATAEQASTDDNNNSKPPVDELLTLLHQVEFDGATGQLVQRLKTRLSKPIDREQFIRLTLDLLRQIFKSINDERQSAQSFLLELNQTLGLVQGALQKTLESRGQFAEQSGVINRQLEHNMSELSESVKTATQLAELKEQVTEHLQAINAALQEKTELEKDERQNFERQHEKVVNKLSHLERQVEQYKRQLAEQKFKSLQDALTKLPNRAAFEERFDVEFERWSRYREPLCLAVADIDFFKRINDNFGHSAGDKTLQVLASMLRKSVKASDFVCRYGGEEFVIIFPQSSLDEAAERLEQAREKISNIPFKFKNDDIRITISVGIAEFTADGDTVQSVFEKADAALYQAKREGRDRLVCASQ